MLNKWGEWAGERLDRRFLLFVTSALLLIGIYFWQLGHLPLGLAELHTLNSSSTFSQIANNPVNAPHNIFAYLLQHFHHASRLALRSVSAVFALVMSYCFYRILKSWFGIFSAWLGTLFFAATPFLILSGRSASDAIMYLWPLTVIAAYMVMMRSRDFLAGRLVLLSLLAGLCLYVPGGIILLVLGSFYIREGLLLYIRRLSRRVQALAALVFILLLAPLVLSAIQHPGILRGLFLVPAHWAGLVAFLKNTAWALAAFVWESEHHSDLQLGRLAILNAAQIILLAFGLFALWNRARSRLYILGFVLLAIALASSLNNSYTLLLFGLPILSLIVTAGLRYLHLEWTTVFPRNPLPRGLAILLLLTLVVLQIVWGVHYSLTAWPHRLPVL